VGGGKGKGSTLLGEGVDSGAEELDAMANLVEVVLVVAAILISIGLRECQLTFY